MIRTSLIVIASILALLAGLVFIVFRPGEPETVGIGGSDPWFEVSVVKPLSSRPLYRIVTFSKGADLRFDHRSPGAATRSVGHDRIELIADGWELIVGIDGDGKLLAGTRIVFPMDLGGDRTLLCRPATSAVAEWVSHPHGNTEEFSGNFNVELATCEDAGTGKVLNWPPAPLTVIASFNRLSAPESLSEPGS